MATRGGEVLQETFLAAGDLSAAQYKVVKLSAANTVTTTGATTDVGIGILQNKPGAAGRDAVVVTRGRTPAVVAGNSVNIAVGDWLGPNASGQLVKKATADYAACAIANGAATADGVVIEVLFMGPGFFRTAGG